MENYGATKTRIFGQTSRGFAALPHSEETNPGHLLQHGDSAATALWLDRHPGVTRSPGALLLEGTPDDGEVDLSRLTSWASTIAKMPQPSCSACALAYSESLDLSVLTASPIGLEPVHTAADITWVNDSKATNVDAAMVGISGIRAPLIVLLGRR